MNEPDDLKLIKKLYGEKMMHLCRTLFPSLLENKGLLSRLMLSKFAPNHELYDDIQRGDYEYDFRYAINSLIEGPKPVPVEDNKSVKELLSEAGYDIYKNVSYMHSLSHLFNLLSLFSSFYLIYLLVL